MTKRIEPREHIIDAELANGNLDAWKQALGFPSSITPKGVYGEMCRDPKLCAGKGYCPRDPACND